MIILKSHECRLTGYYPDDSELEGGFGDRVGNRLRTLQRYLEGTDPYVSVAMDQYLFIPYRTLIWIPSFDEYYNKKIVFKIVDTGDAFNNKGFSRADICCADKATCEDDFLNATHEIVLMMK